ncbi:MAG: histidine phosphatase family protein [Deltaproteobacteria bacterium]|nr:histidine phosphatase family protein [Deltaproteobacteria bacterium]
MRTLFLVRHAETAWNLEHRYQGQTDVPLCDAGRDSAKKLRVRLQKRPQLFCAKTTAVVSSDLSRAKESAELAFATPERSIHLDPDLRELCYGIFEGRSRDEVAAQFSDVYQRFLDDPHYAVEGGEARATVRDRAVSAIRRWLDKLPHPNIVVVTHGGVLRQLMQLALGDGEMPTHVRFNNLAVHLVSVEPAEWTYAGSL